MGQKKAQIARVLGILEKYGAMDYTTIVLASADDPAAMQYIAPVCRLRHRRRVHGDQPRRADCLR